MTHHEKNGADRLARIHFRHLVLGIANHPDTARSNVYGYHLLHIPMEVDVVPPIHTKLIHCYSDLNHVQYDE